MNYYDALKATTQAEADAILEALVAQAMKAAPLLNLGEARAIQRSNIGYATGDLPHSEAGDRQRALVYDLYDCEHPVFGRRSDITPEQALQAGMTVAETMQETGGDVQASIKKARESLE
jgi:hypothetical protein